MIARLLIATVVTTTTLTAVAWQQANTRGPKPHLLLFTDTVNCPPCRRFDKDYKSDTNFRTALNRDYQLHTPYTPQQDQQQFRRYNVTETPTWIVVDEAGNALGRVSGYDGSADLWSRLQAAAKPSSPAESPSIRHRNDIFKQGTPQESELLLRLRAANRAIESERDNLAARIRSLEQDLSAARARVGTAATTDCEERVASLQARLTAAQLEHKKLQLQLQKETAALQERLRRAAQAHANAQAETETLNARLQQPPAADWLENELQAAESHTTSAASISTEIPPPDKPPDKLTGSWSTVFQSVAVAAVTVAAPQFAIPLSAGLGAVGWLWHRRRQRQSAAAVPARVITVDAPPPPQVTQTDTRFVSVEKDTFAQAHAWAQEQLVRRYPGAVPSVETLNSLIQQYLNAMKKD